MRNREAEEKLQRVVPLEQRISPHEKNKLVMRGFWYGIAVAFVTAVIVGALQP